MCKHQGQQRHENDRSKTGSPAPSCPQGDPDHRRAQDRAHVKEDLNEIERLRPALGERGGRNHAQRGFHKAAARSDQEESRLKHGIVPRPRGQPQTGREQRKAEENEYPLAQAVGQVAAYQRADDEAGGRKGQQQPTLSEIAIELTRQSGQGGGQELAGHGEDQHSQTAHNQDEPAIEALRRLVRHSGLSSHWIQRQWARGASEGTPGKNDGMERLVPCYRSNDTWAFLSAEGR